MFRYLSLLVSFICLSSLSAFLSTSAPKLAFVTKAHTPGPLYMASFAADGSEYSSKDSDYDDEELATSPEYERRHPDEIDAPTVEHTPVPMSKNAGNRFVAIVWDQEIDTKGRDALDLHLDRDDTVEDHVMFCRKRNLYNETFNTESMVDILRSLPILSSDLKRIVGHALILESPHISYVREMLEEEPFLKMLNGGDVSNVPLYRWRHIRDYTLRIDDGRFGYPCMMVGMDEAPETLGTNSIREDTRDEFMKYMIKSERVIAAGPLHMATEIKDDPSSIPVGDFVLFNAKNRTDAIQFVEEMPQCIAGLYDDLRVHFYNNLDITGKFVSEDPMRDDPTREMKEALEYWGYPVGDDQTPWLNW